MSVQLNALLNALATGAEEIFKAIRVDASLCERGLKDYDQYELLGLDQLQSTKNTDIKHYLHIMGELGSDGTDDQLWGHISVAVLQDAGDCPMVLDSQIAVNKEGE